MLIILNKLRVVILGAIIICFISIIYASMNYLSLTEIKLQKEVLIPATDSISEKIEGMLEDTAYKELIVRELKARNTLSLKLLDSQINSQNNQAKVVKTLIFLWIINVLFLCFLLFVIDNKRRALKKEEKLS